MTPDNVRQYQSLLSKLGYYGGAIDGDVGQLTLAAVRRFQSDHGLTVDGLVGPKTWAAMFPAPLSPPAASGLVTLDLLKSISTKENPAIVSALVDPMNIYLPAIGISTPLVLAIFLGQAAEETDGFHTLTEYADGSAYEGRRDLGNIYPGDGRKFRGRGIFMNTGRAEYIAAGHAIGVDLVDNPERAAEPEIAVRDACTYWSSHNLTQLALANDVKGVTKRINGGYNGLADRITYTDRARRGLGI